MTLYDASCNGTWLLRRECYGDKIPWSNAASNAYTQSTLVSWVAETFCNYLDIKDIIKTVKIPYFSMSSSAVGSLKSLSNGYSCKGFMLSAKELGNDLPLAGGYNPPDGVLLDYFVSGTTGNARRAAKSGTAYSNYWTRSPATSTSVHVWFVTDDSEGDAGIFTYNNPVSDYARCRPAFILPFDTQVDFQGNIVI